MAAMTAGPATAAAAAPAAAAAEEAVPEAVQDSFTVKITAAVAPAIKIRVIKEVRTMTTLGLREAKELVESAPCTVRTGMTKAESEKFKTILVAAGAEVAIV